MSRYGNVTILPADPNPWADALGLIGGIMGKNAADRQDVKDTDAFISSITPDNTGLLANPTIKAPNATATTGGLLQGNLKDNVTQSLAPNTSFLDNAGSPVTQGPQQNVQPFRQAPQMATMPQQAVQTTPQQTAPKTWNDVQNQYNVNWGQKLKATLATMSPEARKQYLPQIMQMREQDLATLKNDWTKKETANNWDLFNAETDPKKKLFLGTKLSLPAESMKMLLEPDTKTQLVNMGGKYVQVGTNAYTGKMINMETGQPLTAEDLQMTMTPGQSAQIAETARHNGVMESRQASGGGYSYGGGNSSGSNAQKVSMYKWAAGYELQPTGETDMYGKPVMTRVQRNPELAQQLYGELYGNGNGEETPSGGVDYNVAISKVTTAIDKGVSKDKIIAAIRADYGDMADTILADSGLLTAEQPSGGIDLSAPTFGDNGQTLVDYLDSGNAWQDFYNKNRNIGR